MLQQIAWVLELEVREGRDADSRALMAEMVDATRATEPGTIAYEWSASADGRVVHLYERYVDSPAAVTHLQHFGEHFSERFFDVYAPTRLVVSGEPSDALRAALAGLAPTFMTPVAGFAREAMGAPSATGGVAAR